MGLAEIVPPAETVLHRIADCRGAVWLLPAQGEPLSLQVVYNRRYAEVLHEYYEHTETIGAYALWTCKADKRANSAISRGDEAEARWHLAPLVQKPTQRLADSDDDEEAADHIRRHFEPK